MASAVVTVRMDVDTKQAMESVCRELGMSMSTAFNIFAKKVGRERRIPFDLSLDPFYSTENLDHIRRSVTELDAGLGVEHGLIDSDLEA